MKSNSYVPIAQLLASDEELRERLFTPETKRYDSAVARGYAHYMRRAFEDQELGVDAILTLGGRPTIYFKEAEEFDVVSETKAQEAFWNQGMATLLVVSDPQNVRIYSSFVAPSANENSPEASTTREELEERRVVEVLSRAEFALTVRDWILSVETGQFYRSNREKFNSKNTVDRKLLDNLGAASDVLCAGEGKLPREVAHSLLGRVLFVCYLRDREIIKPQYFTASGLSGVSDLRELLAAPTSWKKRRKGLYDLFARLQNDFNGSLLNEDLESEKSVIQEQHLRTLASLLSGDDIGVGQRSLFPFYQFKWIPIETISAIYESFISAEGENVEGQSEQSAVGAFYTPRHLAEMTVDTATSQWDTLLDKRCLDPACGSGIFLVVLFNRMAEECRARFPEETNVERALHLRGLMLQNLCGVDIKRTSCRITCFSLYLAFFDKLTPPDIDALRNELSKTSRKVLPPLLAPEDTAQGQEFFGERPVIFTADFFECDSSLFGPNFGGKFDLVIGNPPWIGRKHQESRYPWRKKIWNWLSSQQNPIFRQVSKEYQPSTFFPQTQSAIAFMWKTPQHLKQDGVGCLVLPAKVLLGDTDHFQRKWLSSFTVLRVLQLADYRRFLFESAKTPTTIMAFCPLLPSEEHILTYDTPKVASLDPRHALIPVFPEEQKQLRLCDVQRAAERGEAGMFWKMYFWGTPRDVRALERLRRFPPLSDLAGEPEENKRWQKGMGVTFSGQGQSPRWWHDDRLFLKAKSKEINLLVLPTDCQKIGAEPTTAHRRRDPRLFEPPLLLINQGFSKFAFCDFPILFQNSLQSIVAPAEDEELLLLLNAVLNSPLSKYFLFHTSSTWGIKEKKIHQNEFLKIPFPLPEQLSNPTRAREIVVQIAASIRQAQDIAVQAVHEEGQQGLCFADRVAAITKAKAYTTELVYDYYELSPRERALVEDTDKIYEPSSTPNSASTRIKTLEEPNFSQRALYAQWLCDTLDGYSRHPSLRLNAREIVAPRLGLSLLLLTKMSSRAPYTSEEAPEMVEQQMARIRALLTRDGWALSYLSDFAYFEENMAYIFKPLALRSWTRSAALGDADAMMNWLVQP